MSPRALGLVGLALFACAMPAGAKTRGPGPDRVWVHPRIESLRPQRIAILPAVSFVYLPCERTYLEDAWMQEVLLSRHTWIPAVLSRERMGWTSRRGDSLLDAIAGQVRSRGRVDSTSCRRLARLLQAQALMCLRIDRWEKGGGARSTRVYVDMTASLVDSTGRLLWRATSEERLESVYGFPKELASGSRKRRSIEEDNGPVRAGSGTAESKRWGGRPGDMAAVAPADLISPDFQAALVRVLERWARSFPESPRVPASSASN